MKAMILAAGYGTRLRPLTENMPKAIIPVANTPLIKYNLLLLKKYGIEEVIINIHYLSDLIKGLLGDGSNLEMKISYSYEPEILGTAGGIKKVEDFLKGESFLVINSDILVDIDLQEVIDFHYQKKAMVTMVLRKNNSPDQYGAIEVDSAGIVRQFLGKLNWEGEPLRKMMFTGIHILQPAVLNYITPNMFVSISDQTYPQIISAGKLIYGYLMNKGYWQDVGTPKRYLDAHREILQGRFTVYNNIHEVEPGIWIGKNIFLDPTVNLIKPLMIGDNSKIESGAVLGPYVVIGDNCHIRSNTKIHNTVLWENEIINEGTLLSHSILGNGLFVRGD
ncbi:MAG: NDP-sugar synthase [bacterium]